MGHPGGTGTCLTALSHKGLQAHTGVVIDQVNAVPSIQAWAGLTFVHLCKGRSGKVVMSCVGAASSPGASQPG